MTDACRILTNVSLYAHALLLVSLAREPACKAEHELACVVCDCISYPQVHRALPDKRELLTLLTTPQTHTPVPHPHTPRSRLLNMQQYANLLYALVRLRLIPKGADAWMARYWNATRVLLVLAAPRVGKGAKSAGAAPLRAALAARPLLPRHCVQLLWSVARLDGVYPPRVWVRALEGQLEQQVGLYTRTYTHTHARVHTD